MALEWPFRLNEEGGDKVLSGASATYPEVIEKKYPGEEREYALDLSGLVAKLWIDQGVDKDKFYFDERTNAEVSVANKRAADEAGKPYL